MKKLIIISSVVTSLALIIPNFFTKLMLICIIFGSKPIFPEASSVVQHYCFGDGSDLILNSDYLRSSPVIVENLNKMKIGEQRRISFKQNKDWRLSYAINGFTLIKKQDKVIIKQYITFDKTNNVYTYLNFLFFEIKINDNFVHVFDCKPFWVYSEFKI